MPEGKDISAHHESSGIEKDRHDAQLEHGAFDAAPQKHKAVAVNIVEDPLRICKLTSQDIERG